MLLLPRQARGGAVLMARASVTGPVGAPSPLLNPRGDLFLSTLSATSPEQLTVIVGGERCGEDHLPFLEIFQNLPAILLHRVNGLGLSQHAMAPNP
jgi:hypothetical protein